MSAIRQDRINEEVKKVVGEIIREMKDPRVSEMATITQAEVTADLKQAKLRVSVYEQDEEKRQETIAALNHAAGFITREMGRRIQLRRLPSLKFLLDTSIEYSVHISRILDGLQARPADSPGPEEPSDG